MRLIACILGDGCVHKNGIRYINSDIKLINSFICDVKKTFGEVEFILGKDKKGVYIVAENGLALPHENIFFVEDTRKALALLSKAYFHHPDKDLFIVGITGTNGKTTTTYMIRSILAVMGIKTGIIGTIQYLIGDESIKAENTTPESYEIFKMFHEMKEKGCKAVAMEISSHALSMSRVYGIDLDMAVFTNLTQDHLDYHKTFEEYLKAKLQIFTLLSKSSKEKKMALINRDIPEFEELKKSLSINHLPYQTYGIHYPADWQGISSSMNIYHNLFHTSLTCLYQYNSLLSSDL